LRAVLGISDDLVTLLTFGSAVEAHLAKGRLEMEGIESFVADEYAAATFGLSQTDGIRLQVRESDMGRALEIMGIEDDDEQDEQDEQDEEQEVTCPRCGSDDVRPPFLGQEWRCKACGHRWVL
jgi:DNA-directed RNA polymerase subunit RPC12/RpoP